MKHIINNSLLRNTVKVALVGCGGVGSQVLTGLARLHTALVALGHPHGLDVVAFDDDTVSDANVGRQLFSPADVGHNKAVLLIHRLNSYFGLNWTAIPRRFPETAPQNYDHNSPHIVISCVDTKAARRKIAEYVPKSTVCYWLDMGNNLADGQVILGQPGYGKRISKEKRENNPILPTVTDLYPIIIHGCRDTGR